MLSEQSRPPSVCPSSSISKHGASEAGARWCHGGGAHLCLSAWRSEGDGSLGCTRGRVVANRVKGKMPSALSSVRWWHYARMGRSQGVKRYMGDHAFHLCECLRGTVCVSAQGSHMCSHSWGERGPTSDRLSSWTSHHHFSLLCCPPPFSTSLQLKLSKQIEYNWSGGYLLLR